MIAPEPFFEPRGTPFSEFHRIRALVELGHTVDLVTYPFGKDVTLADDEFERLLDELASGQVPDQDGRGPPGQAELPGELGPGELSAAVVDRAQEPREIVGAQLGTSGRRAFVLPHTPIVPCLLTLPVRGAYQGYQSQ